jgi:hypothetical protein
MPMDERWQEDGKKVEDIIGTELISLGRGWMMIKLGGIRDN